MFMILNIKDEQYWQPKSSNLTHPNLVDNPIIDLLIYQGLRSEVQPNHKYELKDQKYNTKSYLPTYFNRCETPPPPPLSLATKERWMLQYVLKSHFGSIAHHGEP